MASLSHHEWAIPMGGQVSLEAERQRRVDEVITRRRAARAALMGETPGRPAKIIRDAVDEMLGVERRCYCPDDCRCRRETNPPCGCREHETSCCGDPADCTERCS